MEIRRVSDGDAAWPAFVAHLERARMARHALDDAGRLADDFHALAAVEGDEVVGHLVLNCRPLVVPETEWSAGRDHAVRGADGEPVTETFVATFAVDEGHRRRGHGRALQRAALDLSRELGAWQMRSWSSLDRPENYALKLSLGFTASPTTEPWGRDGSSVCGMYFTARTGPPPAS
jgi:GNAT superfamily N-acetyltransferase